MSDKIITAYNPRTFERFAFDSETAFEFWVQTNNLTQGKVHPTNFHTEELWEKVSDISGEYLQYEVNKIPIISGTTTPLVEHPEIVYSDIRGDEYVKLIHEEGSETYYLHWTYKETPNSTSMGSLPYRGIKNATVQYNKKLSEIFPQEA